MITKVRTIFGAFSVLNLLDKFNSFCGKKVFQKFEDIQKTATKYADNCDRIAKLKEEAGIDKVTAGLKRSNKKHEKAALKFNKAKASANLTAINAKLKGQELSARASQLADDAEKARNFAKNVGNLMQ